MKNCRRHVKFILFVCEENFKSVELCDFRRLISRRCLFVRLDSANETGEMANSSNESLIMTLLEQIRALEDERDKALQLAGELGAKIKMNGTLSTDSSEDRASVTSSNSEESEPKLEKLREENEVLRGTIETMTQTVVFDLEEIRLNEEQRRFNLKELICEQQNDKSGESNEDMDANSYRTMLDMCKKYYGKMVAELQEERGSLQQKIEKQQALLLEKDMKITELEVKLQQISKK